MSESGHVIVTHRAVETAAQAIYAARGGIDWECESIGDILGWRADARAALTAALPIIREQIAREQSSD